MATAVATKPAETAAYTDAWAALEAQVKALKGTHLRDLLQDDDRCSSMVASHPGLTLDYSCQKATKKTMFYLHELAKAAGVQEKVAAMMAGTKINPTEGRSVLHVALRASRDAVIESSGANVVPDVHAVLDKVKAFSDRVRSGEWVGATGKALTDVVSIGIGGSYLGPEFAYEALRMDATAGAAASGRRLRFLANVDPVDVARAREGLDPETTLVVVVSKTFTTAETMLNARTMRSWLVDALGEAAVAKHMVAVSTNADGVKGFGMDPENMFGFWDWVGGRYSVCSAVGVVPLALQYGFDVVDRFLAGARDMDTHFATAAPEANLPILMGLLGVWNNTFLGHATRALLPYQQALLKLAPHIQQVDMESNGKGVKLDGSPLGHAGGPVNFGEPGTNGQHSFYQLMHQGRVVPADFVGVIAPQTPIHLAGEPVSNHEELMCNFFAQPDALALGKAAAQLASEGVPSELIPHKTFTGDRPSSSILMDRLDAFSLGQLLALFEHRTAVEGFVWGINSFDQWGVELGKVLAKQVRTAIAGVRSKGGEVSGFNASTTALLKKFLQG